ncbi:uncharacterized protein LOC125658985 isoform X2 [Ostrea edulis]|uniref:uncharacterized protein LOC125658985 isoform X2 n=1 Tax=Ostrea edulis TaxID=37623 RepID=UPI0024AFC19A|nr:uncharacterized protein LOC125658985 isoform X2 [Ostrea edulis]
MINSKIPKLVYISTVFEPNCQSESSIRMEDIRITIILVLSLVAGLQAARCRPCDGSSSSYADKLNTCNHHVTKESVLNSLKSLNETFRSFKREMETQYNIIQGFDISTFSTTCVEDPLTDTIKKHLPKTHKDRFIHETYATLSYAYDVLEKASYNFEGERWILKGKLTKVMCKMVSVNRKIHCRKNRQKPSQQMKSFDVTKVCERRNVFPCGYRPLWTLKALGNVQTIIEYTLRFWDSCVKDNSRNDNICQHL